MRGAQVLPSAFVLAGRECSEICWGVFRVCHHEIVNEIFDELLLITPAFLDFPFDILQPFPIFTTGMIVEWSSFTCALAHSSVDKPLDMQIDQAL